MPETKRIVKSTQEQAVAAWINNLNQIRLDTLIENIMQQEDSLESALYELSELKEFISNPSHILGSDFTKHGEIAEHMQVNISNARQAVQGLRKEYTFDGVGRTAPEDYLKNGQPIQSKFYNGLKQTFFNKHGVEDHLKTYEFFVRDGGSYDIPMDQYEQLEDILEKYRDSPSKLSTSDYMLAKRINDFLDRNNLEVGKNITPAVNDYSEVQMRVAEKVVDKEEQSIRKINKQKRDDAYRQSKPTVKEGIKAAEVSAAFEGGITFCLSVAEKRKEKNFSDFTLDDWCEVGIDTTKGALKGGIRGGVIYQLTNFTQTPACVASALVTATFGVAGQVRALENNEVSPEDFVINCETVCLDVTVSAIASLLGQIAIPVPVLGAVIGNVAGEFVYDLCKKEGSERAQAIIDGYQRDIQNLNKELDRKYLKVVEQVLKEFLKYESIETLAFDKDVNIAFVASVELAESVGVDPKKIIRNRKQRDSFFMD